MTNRITTPTTPTTRQFVVLVKRRTPTRPREVYIFFYPDTPTDRVTIMRVFGRFASNPDLSFTWGDAAKLSQQVRREVKGA